MSSDIETARTVLTKAAKVLTGPHPIEVRFRAMVDRATVELDAIARDPAAGRDPGLLVWRLAIPGALGDLGREELPETRPGTASTVLAWILLAFSAVFFGLLPYSGRLPPWLENLWLLGPLGLLAATISLVAAALSRSRWAATVSAVNTRRHQLITLEANLVVPLAELRARTRPADFSGPASLAADEISNAAAHLATTAARLSSADPVVDRLGSVVTDLVAVLPEITGGATAVAAPFTAAADRLEAATTTLGSATDALNSSLIAMDAAIEKANWLALIADGIRTDEHVDPLA